MEDNNKCIWADLYGFCSAIERKCPYLNDNCQDECEDFNDGSFKYMLKNE